MQVAQLGWQDWAMQFPFESMRKFEEQTHVFPLRKALILQEVHADAVVEQVLQEFEQGEQFPFESKKYPAEQMHTPELRKAFDLQEVH